MDIGQMEWPIVRLDHDLTRPELYPSMPCAKCRQVLLCVDNHYPAVYLGPIDQLFTSGCPDHQEFALYLKKRMKIEIFDGNDTDGSENTNIGVFAPQARYAWTARVSVEFPDRGLDDR
jgi:hypothetical protein